MPIHTYMKAPTQPTTQPTTPTSMFPTRPWSQPAEVWQAKPRRDPATPRPQSASASFSFGQINLSRSASAGPDNAPGVGPYRAGSCIPLASQPTPKLNLNRTGLPTLAGMQSRPVVQPKLTIGAPADKYEREADRVAAQVVQRLHTPANPAIQPQAAPKTEELRMKPQLRLKGSEGSMAAPSVVESSIQQLRGHGQPLAEPIRQPMEQAFGADFSGVRVHTDAQADQLNQSMQAKAFTTGQDLFFRQGAYEPGSRGGQALLAHELTHVVQQKGIGMIQLAKLSGACQENDKFFLSRNGHWGVCPEAWKKEPYHITIYPPVNDYRIGESRKLKDYPDWGDLEFDQFNVTHDKTREHYYFSAKGDIEWVKSKNAVGLDHDEWPTVLRIVSSFLSGIGVQLSSEDMLKELEQRGRTIEQQARSKLTKQEGANLRKSSGVSKRLIIPRQVRKNLPTVEIDKK